MYEFFCKRDEAKNLQSKAPESPPLYTNSELVHYQNWKLRYKLNSPLIRYCLLNELLNLSIICWLIFAFLCRISKSILLKFNVCSYKPKRSGQKESKHSKRRITWRTHYLESILGQPLESWYQLRTKFWQILIPCYI